MKAITKAEFFRRIKAGPTAKVASEFIKGNAEMTDDYVEQLLAKSEQLTFRSVAKVQTNAVMFNDNSWLWFDKPKNCDSRKAYLHSLEGNTFISLVDHRPAYSNQFGTPISEQTMVLVYQLAV